MSPLAKCKCHCSELKAHVLDVKMTIVTELSQSCADVWSKDLRSRSGLETMDMSVASASVTLLPLTNTGTWYVSPTVTV